MLHLQETGQKNMVKTINDITQKNYKKLSIQVSLSGLSFCVFDTITDKVLVHNAITFTNQDVFESQLWKAFVNNSVLTKNYDEILVLHDNSLNTFVPTVLFDEVHIASYLQYNVKVFDSDYFTNDTLNNYEIENIYVPFVNVNNFLLDQFSSFEYKNTNSILVEKVLDKSKNIDDKTVYVHLQENHFEIIIAKNQQLLFFNSFEHTTKEDFIYYLLFTLEQMQLNPETVSVLLFGKITTNNPLFKIAYQFIRNCSLLDLHNTAQTFGVSIEEASNHFILFNS